VNLRIEMQCAVELGWSQAWEREAMFVIIGIVVVIRSIVGGYLMEHGNLKVLIQPAELVIIGGRRSGQC
jgi:hypothetical protein